MVDSGSPDIAERILSTRRDLSEPEEAVIRLKKVVASKDAQVEALTSRIEVLSDELQEARSEVAKLRGISETAMRFEDVAKRASDRADAAEAARADAEAALVAAEEAFARHILSIKELMQQASAPAAALPTPAVVPSPMSHAAPSVLAIDNLQRKLEEEIATLRGQLADANARNKALEEQVETLSDELIHRTECELRRLSVAPPTSPAPFSAAGRPAHDADGGQELAQLGAACEPRPQSSHAGAAWAQTPGGGGGEDGPLSAGGASERGRWLQELSRGSVAAPSTQVPDDHVGVAAAPIKLVFEPSNEGYAAAAHRRAVTDLSRAMAAATPSNISVQGMFSDSTGRHRATAS